MQVLDLCIQFEYSGSFPTLLVVSKMSKSMSLYVSLATNGTYMQVPVLKMVYIIIFAHLSLNRSCSYESYRQDPNCPICAICSWSIQVNDSRERGRVSVTDKKGIRRDTTTFFHRIAENWFVPIFFTKAGDFVFGGLQKDHVPILLSDDILDEFSLSKMPKEQRTPNSHLSLLAMVYLIRISNLRINLNLYPCRSTVGTLCDWIRMSIWSVRRRCFDCGCKMSRKEETTGIAQRRY